MKYLLALVLTTSLWAQTGRDAAPGTVSSETMTVPHYYCADAGSTDAYACSVLPPLTAYAVGQAYRFKANTANTGAATVNFNGLGAIAIKTAAGADLVTGDIVSGQMVDVVYKAGPVMQMQSGLGNVVITFTPQMFGAAGNGVTDDHDAILACLNQASSTYGVCYIPKTSLGYLTSEIAKTSGDNYSIKSNGAKLIQSAVTGYILYLANSTNVTIDGLVFYGAGGYSAAGPTAAQLVGIDSMQSVRVSNSRFENFGFCGICIYSTYAPGFNDIDISANTFIGPGSPTISPGGNYNFGVNVNSTTNGGSDLRIRGNYFNDVATGIFTGPNISNVLQANNQFNNIVGQHCSYNTSVTNLSFTGNTCKDPYLSGFKHASYTGQLAGFGYNTSVTGNVFMGNGTTTGTINAIEFSANNPGAAVLTGVVETGNAIYNWPGVGVAVNYTTNLTLGRDTMSNVGTRYSLGAGMTAPSEFPITITGVPCSSTVGNGTNTIGVPGLGGAPSGACAQTAYEAYGTIIPHACVLQNLYVKSGTNGADASDGVITVQVGGSATAITCTVGAGATCSDTTNTHAITAGSQVWIKGNTNSTNLSTVAVSIDCK